MSVLLLTLHQDLKTRRHASGQNHFTRGGTQLRPRGIVVGVSRFKLKLFERRRFPMLGSAAGLVFLAWMW